MFKRKVSRVLKGFMAAAMTISSVSVMGLNTVKNVHAVEAEESYTQYVDPFVSTDVDYGQLFPGPVVPNGLVKLCADTYPHDTLDHAGYDYSKMQIQGFSHTRIEGVGGQGAGGDVLVTPTYVQYSKRPQQASRAMKYTKDGEFAKPGFYSVELTPNTGKNDEYQSSPELGKIKAKMTTDQRTGYHSYTFPKAGNVNIITDLNYCYHGTGVRNAVLDVIEQSEVKTAIGGRFSGQNVGGSGRYTMYFYMETSKPAKKVKTWNNQDLTSETSQRGNDIGAIMNFDVKDNEEIQLKVSISPISVDQAKRDMNNEVPGWDFEAVKANADKQWNDVLSKVRVESSEVSDPTGELKKLFYTHLYHMFMTPVNATSTEGTFRGTDGNIHEAKDYTHYDSWTLWDDYRKYPMIGLVQPDVYKDMVRSIANALDYGIVTWSHDKQPVPNVRTEHAVALLADGVAKGFTDIENLEEAYREAIKIADKVVKNGNNEQLGYIPGRMDQTAEYAYDDWALSLIADALGYEEEADYYLNRSFNYKNLYKPNADSETIDGVRKDYGLLISRNSDGSWKSVNPRSYSAGLYQGTHWQYTWYLSNDVNGLMDLMGGKQQMFDALSMLFGEHTGGRTIMHNAANEVELHAPYLFNFAGRPDRTQYWVRTIYTKETYNDNYTGSSNAPQKMYKLSPQGYLHTMDDDAGTMAMMFVSAAMGIFPMTPGDTTFQIGSPFFEKMTLDVGNGKTFTIEANNVSPDNFYIQSATLNGKSFDRTWVDYSEITRGGVLSFEMGDQPSNWASDGVPAASASDAADTSTYDNDEIAYSTAMLSESDKNDGSFDQKLNITLKTKQFTGNVGDDLATNGAIEISNVPAGLTASAVKTADNKVEVALNGKADKHTLNDSIGNLTIKINDTATNEVIEGSIRKIKNNVKVMFDDTKLIYSTTMFKEAMADDGTIADSATITLTGDATFTGAVNDDLVAAGKVAVTNVPEGLTAKVVKTGDKTAVLSFAGKAVNHDYDVEIETSFNDSAFDGAKASEVEKSACGGMTALLLDFYLNPTAKLEAAVAKAKEVDVKGYTIKSVKELKTALQAAEAILAAEATSEELEEAYYNLVNAMDHLTVKAIVDSSIISTDDFVYATDNENPLTGSEGPLALAFDGDTGTFWHTQYQPSKKPLPATVTIDMAKAYEINQIDYLPRPGGGNGNITSYELYGKLNETDEYTLLDSGTWADNGNMKTISLDNLNLRYLKLVAKDGRGGYASAAEFYMHKVDDKTPLREALAKAREYDEDKYTEDSWIVLEEAMVNAKAIIAKEDATLAEVNKAVDAINEAIENLVNAGKPATIRLEAEEFDEGPGIAKEGFHTGNNENGEWVKFSQVDFDEGIFNQLQVRYAGNKGNCAPDARIEVRIDDRETGEVVAKMDTHPTGTWDDYVLVVDEILRPDLLKGVHDVYITFLGSSGKWIANYDYYEFVKVETKTHIEAEDKDDWSADKLKIEQSTDNTGKTLTNIGGVTNNAWLRYNGVNFDDSGLTEFTVRYSHNPGTAGKNSRIDVYLDNMDGQPVGSIDLPTTNGWANYTIISTVFNEKISGEHDVFLKLHVDSGWVANFDWIEFDVNYDVVKADKEALQALYDEYKDTVNDHYTEASWAEFLGALDNAKAVLADENAAQEDVDNATKALQETFDGLVKAEAPVTDKTALQIAVEMAETVDTTNVIPTVKAEFVAALTEAKAILADEYATQAQIDASFVRLATAMHMLEFVKGDKADLEALIKVAEGLTETDYTKASWANLVTVLGEARGVVADENAMQDEINDMVAKLQAAIDGLVKLADKSKLEALVEKVSKLEADKYLPDSWAKFAEALNNANAILEAEEPTQAEVDAAYNELIRAYLGLRLVPNKDALKDLVNQAKALNEPALANAIASAEALLANDNATQEEITVAYNILNTAINTLTPVKDGDTTVNSGVKTGDAVNMMAPLAGLLAAGYVLIRKKED